MLNSKITILILIFLFGAPLVIAQSCFSDAQCSNGGDWYPNAQKQLVREYCSSEGVCKIDEIRNVECARDDDCSNGFICDTAHASPTAWTCLQIDKYADNSNEQQQYSGTSDNNTMLGASIIGGCVVIGLIVLGLILRRKKN
jgi:Cys-rich repeat protein